MGPDHVENDDDVYKCWFGGLENPKRWKKLLVFKTFFKGLILIDPAFNRPTRGGWGGVRGGASPPLRLRGLEDWRIGGLKEPEAYHQHALRHKASADLSNIH